MPPLMLTPGGSRFRRIAGAQFLFAFFLSLLWHPTAARAQVLYGALTGTVTDASAATVGEAAR